MSCLSSNSQFNYTLVSLSHYRDMRIPYCLRSPHCYLLLQHIVFSSPLCNLYTHLQSKIIHNQGAMTTLCRNNENYVYTMCRDIDEHTHIHACSSHCQIISPASISSVAASVLGVNTTSTISVCCCWACTLY